MKKKIDQIIKNLLLYQKKNLNNKYILISKNYSIIEYINKKYLHKFNKIEFFTIKKFLEKISGFKILDDFYIILYLISTFKKDDLLNVFHNFLNCLPKILNDFKDLDLNFIDVEPFFYSVISAERIQNWNINIKDIFWEKIHEYYYILRSKLLKEGKLYKGMLFEEIITYHLNFFFKKNLNTKIIFFFIKTFINKYEKEFIKKLTLYNKQVFIYDLSELENNSKKNDQFLILEKENIVKTKKIKSNLKVISVSKEIEQVKIVETLVSKFLLKNKRKKYKILIIPGDNSLFIPLISSIKKNIKINKTSINIDINYPLKNIPINYVFHSIFKLLIKKNNFKKFIKKDVIRVLLNGYIQNFFLKKNSFLKKLNVEDGYFVSNSMIKKYLSKNDLWIIFQIPTENTKKILISFISFIRKIKKFLLKNINKHLLELKFIFKLEVYIQKLRIIVRKNKHLLFGIDDIFHLYEIFINTENIRYINKNKGKEKLYITGFTDIFFENFDVSIITSFNEGIIPPYNKKNSFIPIDIRKKFKIDDKNNNYYLNHFTRILKSSKKMFLIYKNHPDEINSGEKSRFIHQIEMNHKMTIEEKILPFLTKNLIRNPIIIKKTKYIIHRLHELIKKGISPSSINLYNYNPLLFYYKKILKLKNIEQPSLKKEMGKIIHKILKILYTPMKGNYITIDSINKIKNNYESIIKQIFSKDQEKINDRNMLFFFITKNYIKNFILWDEKFVKNGKKIFIKEIEYKISTKLNIKSKIVNIHGIIDRIDECDGITRIIDYKIGYSKTNEINVSFKNIENIFKEPNYAKTMQLLIYLYLWFKSSFFVESKKNTIIELISPKNIDGKSLVLQIPINFFQHKKRNITYEDYIKKILPFLIGRISEIINPKIPIIEKIY
ncbi:PD-(D/E)XK nuclease family protein [Blattabacterium cuenoti]|uniref:PD-(D/E)XK nuclease family protein n=1 Tax=Blattabacterium cuenoti TaxID=1653831 RepID=UPI00163BCC70|nr:PD-(D/E)XK nuclease family protein [Blattabacterium cuenoti]